MQPLTQWLAHAVAVHSSDICEPRYKSSLLEPMESIGQVQSSSEQVIVACVMYT